MLSSGAATLTRLTSRLGCTTLPDGAIDGFPPNGHISGGERQVDASDQGDARDLVFGGECRRPLHVMLEGGVCRPDLCTTADDHTGLLLQLTARLDR